MMLKNTDVCVVRLDKGEGISAELAEILDEADIATFGAFTVTREQPTELHFHDYDEHWLFTEGSTTVTLRLPDGAAIEYDVEPNTLIVTPAGVEHGHVPKSTVKGVQFVSKIKPGARTGHLYR
jgi:mannose-6-phosphate isomerase-like protein (cupin superfamily)